jgi:predicted AAA+ superfamily ATPase
LEYTQLISIFGRMIERDIHKMVLKLAGMFPVVTITGPRQAGKTTLARMAFPDYTYCNLEYPETRSLAQIDPRSFFAQYPAPVIIDEIQRVPGLLSYIQVQVDELKQNGMFILTGSQQLYLDASISQSLAGRTALVTLLPFSFNEASQFESVHFQRDQWIFNGFLPRIYDQRQEPLFAYRSYLHTYVERDVRQLVNLKELSTFEKFLKLLAGRIGQIINTSSLANDTGVSTTTISSWLSVLEASFIIFKLHPYFENFGKRVIKSPKIYFMETGLACYLLGIEHEKQVGRDPLLGGLFENLVVIEALKARTNRGLDPNMHFYRDSHHNEVDLVCKYGERLIPVEIKSSQTFHPDFTKSVIRFRALAGQSDPGYIVYGGTQSFETPEKVKVIGFGKVSGVFDSWA